MRNPNDDLCDALLSIYDLMCRINSFRGLRRIASHEVIDRLLLQITTPERGFLLEEIVNRV